MKLPSLLSLDGYSKQAYGQADLPVDVSFAYISELSLADHIHDLVSLQRSLCHFKGKEVHPWLDKPIEKAMVMSDQII